MIKHRAFRWEGVELKPYKASAGAPFKDVTRQTLLGEAVGDEALRFITRYFEVQPGGHSTLERHQHPHAVVILRGTGQVILGGQVHDLAPFDCVYVSPRDPHQFRATGTEPLGFLCVVDRERDRPQVLTASGER